LFPILFALYWDYLNGSEGHFAFQGPFGEHVDRSGLALGFVLVLVQIKTDWPAFNLCSATRSWAHASFPCPLCNIPKRCMLSMRGATLHKLSSYNNYSEQDYLDEVARCKKVALFCLVPLDSDLVGPLFARPGYEWCPQTNVSESQMHERFVLRTAKH
jgi:hypothetical protein